MISFYSYSSYYLSFNFLFYFFLFSSYFLLINSQFGSLYPPGCNKTKARICEQNFLECRLFRGPADDPTTMCQCGQEFYGSCIRLAGCEFHKEFDPLGSGEIYEKKCVDHIVKYNCDDTLICGLNCATETTINRTISKIIPFNNYGDTYLRLRFCDKTIHKTRLQKYSNIQPIPCDKMSDFKICTRWIPPFTFIPVALPSNTTYMEIDYCEEYLNGTKYCHSTDPKPARVYGNAKLFPSSFNVAQTNVSICSTDGIYLFLLIYLFIFY